MLLTMFMTITLIPPVGSFYITTSIMTMVTGMVSMSNSFNYSFESGNWRDPILYNTLCTIGFY